MALPGGALADRRPFRIFTVVRDLTRERPAIAADARPSSERVTAVRERPAAPWRVVCGAGKDPRR